MELKYVFLNYRSIKTSIVKAHKPITKYELLVRALSGVFHYLHKMVIIRYTRDNYYSLLDFLNVSKSMALKLHRVKTKRTKSSRTLQETQKRHMKVGFTTAFCKGFGFSMKYAFCLIVLEFTVNIRTACSCQNSQEGVRIQWEFFISSPPPPPPFKP